MLHLLLAIVVAVILHVGVIAISARAIGVHVELVSLGIGPTLFQTNGYRLGAVPVGGYVRLRHASEDIDGLIESRTAIDRRSTIAQIGITVSGCIALVLLAIALQGANALSAFTRFPVQILGGALSPLGAAQSLLHGAARVIQTASFGVTLALVASKLAVFNLLPLPFLNGGAAVAILAKRIGLSAWWPTAATQLLGILLLCAVGSWLLALTMFVSMA